MTVDNINGKTENININNDIDENFIKNLINKIDSRKPTNLINKINDNNNILFNNFYDKNIDITTSSNFTCRQMARTTYDGIKTVKFEFNPF